MGTFRGRRTRQPELNRHTDPHSAAGSSHRPKHECGVFAVYGHKDAALLTYYGLFALQHRGQESAGIAAGGSPGAFRVHKGMGLVSQVFSQNQLESLEGTRAIGHVRYSTTGSSTLLNSQPLCVDTSRGQLAVAHNGNLVNAAALRAELESSGSIFQTTVDSEIVLHLMAQPDHTLGGPIGSLRRLEGAFSLVLMGEDEVIGVRDPNGLRPLSLGKVGDAWILSSETCAFDLVGAEFVRDLEPGEVVVINDQGIRSEFPFTPAREAFCVFEYVYFARPDSRLRGATVSKVRVNMGRELARLHPVEADVVIPVPDSGIYAALGFAEELGIPYDPAFVRNHYIGRTFIQPTQLIRDFNVRVKLNLIGEAVKGRRVVVVDDSVVRGTTAKSRVVNLREAGAREVHLRISCPPHRHACYYGIDFPDPEKLIANQHTHAEICEYLGADSIGYLDEDGMVRATGLSKDSFCMACFNGQYPVHYDAAFDKLVMEKRRGSAKLLADQNSQPPLFAPRS